mmetsp:Transcript_18363/g.35093  ORF Transcript_18363/g.35093 Transcript_18363/m.35093 type:complete len:213 (-) Transcript_18363:102-740(-)|eukprot:scaffold1982_cov93-Amphora_coffeaeformis.AAC.6
MPPATDSTPLMEEGRAGETPTPANVGSNFVFISFADADVINEGNYGWILALGIINIIGGVACLLLPVMAAVVAESVISWTLILLGGLNLSGIFWGEPGTRGHFFGLGIVQVFLGVLMLNNPFETLTFIGILIAVKVLLDGVYMLSLCAMNPQVRGWALCLLSGCASVLLGLYVLIHIQNGTAIILIGVVLGANLLTVGTVRIHMALKGAPNN